MSIKVLPDGWRELTLGDASHLFAGGTPSRSDPKHFDGDIPWVKSGEVNSGKITSTEEHITEEALKNSSAKIAPAGCNLIAMYGATAGKIAKLKIDAAINQAICAVVPNENVSDSDFLFHALTNSAQGILKKVQGSGQPNLSKQLLSSHIIMFPPLPEQRRIAEILSSVDDAIAATQAVIDQEKIVRRALLENLFHRGSWDEGKKIPQGWKLTLLDSVTRRGSGHTPSKSYPEYWNGGVKWISLQDTKRLDKIYISETTSKISNLGITNSSAVIHPAGTVVVSRDATVGLSTVMTEPMAVSQHFISWHCGKQIDNLYLYYWLQHMKPILERIGSGSTIKTIGLQFFKSLEIPLPDVATQRKLAEAMKGVDDAIFGSQRAIEELTRIKTALMSELLNGRKRVVTTAKAAE